MNEEPLGWTRTHGQECFSCDGDNNENDDEGDDEEDEEDDDDEDDDGVL